MLCKFVLIIDEVSYELSNSAIKNWKEVSYSLKRTDYSGITRTFTSKFEFINDAYDLLLSEYRQQYLMAAAMIEVYTVTNNHEYELRFRCPLDFSSMKIEAGVLSMNSVDDSIASLIKSQKGTQFEYLVKDMKEAKQLYYDRLELRNNIKYVIVGDKTDDNGNSIFVFSSNKDNPSNEKDAIVEYTSAEVVKRSGFLYSDLPRNESAYPFFVSENGDLSGTLSGRIVVKCYEATNIGSIRLYIWRKKRASVSVFNGLFYPDGTSIVFDLNEAFSIDAGEILHCSFIISRAEQSNLDSKGTIEVDSSSRIELTFNSRSMPEMIDVISPQTLLNKLLNSINGGKDGIIGEIESGSDTRLDNSLIVAAESIRNLPNAKLYSSFSKFEDWMCAEFGYVPVIEASRVIFKHRNNLYSGRVTKDIGDNIESPSYSVNSSIIYSSLKVGYEKQDYDSVNGRDEFRFTNEYSTGITLTDNVFELKSPYRADACGFELLTQKRGEDTTDSSNDNDTFFVCSQMSENGSRYELVRDGYTISGVLTPDSMFNVMYSPRFMIEANKRFIGVFAKTLLFSSSEGNADIVINGVVENADIDINGGLFTVGEFDFITNDDTLPPDMCGLVRCIFDNDVYFGYVKEVGCKYGQYDGMNYKLFVNSIQ